MADTCVLCGLDKRSENSEPRFAVWLHARGWLVDICGNAATTSERLFGATWFDTEDEAQVALEAVDRADGGGAEYLSEVGEVVTL